MRAREAKSQKSKIEASRSKMILKSRTSFITKQNIAMTLWSIGQGRPEEGGDQCLRPPDIVLLPNGMAKISTG